MSAFWACCATHTAAEQTAVRNLRLQHYNSFFPYWLVPSSRYRHRLMVQPVFKGYVFVEIAPDRPWAPINNTIGVKRLLTLSSSNSEYRQPAQAGAFVESMRGLRRHEGHSSTLPLLPTGAVVKIVRGPLAEQVALVELSAGDRVRLLLEIFSREVVVEVDVGDVQLVEVA